MMAKRIMQATLAGLALCLLMAPAARADSAANQHVSVSCAAPGVSVTVDGNRFDIFAPGYPESFAADVMVVAVNGWVLVKPKASALPLKMRGGNTAGYEVERDPEDEASGTIAFHNYHIKSDHDGGAKDIVVPAGASVTYTAYRNGAARKSDWSVNGPDTSEVRVDSASIVFNRSPDDVTGWFVPAIEADSPGVFSIQACDVSQPLLEDSGSMTVVAGWLNLPDVVGVNDLVPNCTDMTGRNKWYDLDLTTAAQYAVEPDILLHKGWDVAPRDESLGEITIKGDGERIRVLALKDGNLVVSPAFSPTDAAAEFKIEGISHSLMPDDAMAELIYSVCTVTARTTVVQVELDKFCYNRANPYPEITITSVSGLTPGGTATVIYKVLDDILDTNVPQLTGSFAVATAFGTYEYKTPPYVNRIGNSGRDAIRYTVYDDNGVKAARWSHADPDNRALVELPASAQMQIEIKDALADTPEEARAHLVSVPSFAGSVNTTGTCPAYVIADIKVLAKTPSPAYANEICAAPGNEVFLQTLHNVSQASAVVLEITGSHVVSVNDRFGAGDPGDDALEDRDTTDPDFIELKLGGFPDGITEGTIEWEITANARCIRLVSAPAAAQVGSKVTFGFAGGLADHMKRIFIEGREASEEIDDVTVTVRIIIDGSEANPPAFRGQTLAADFRLTVTDLRWADWKADNVAGKSDERPELLVCDLDLRPAVRLDQPQGGTTFARDTVLTVAGAIRSMTDIVSDIRVNGETVSHSDIRFLGTPLAGLTSVSDLTDQPPPYIVTFTHTLTQFDGSEVKVEARNGVATSPGYARRAVSYNGTTGTVSTALITSPTYSEPTMVDFLNGSEGWEFLYKTEVDHCGAGVGVVECVETCGAQPGNGLYRLRQPLIFVSAADKHPSLAAPGLFIKNGLSVNRQQSTITV